MSLAQGQIVTADDINALKTKVNNEMLRRQYRGSLTAQATNYSVTPAVGGKILAEHQTKIITPLNAISATGIGLASSGDTILSLAAADTLVTNYAAIAATAANSGCASSCSGLCQGYCDTSCSGCSGSCTSCTGCSGSCTSCSGCSGCSGCGGCGGDCTAACASRCQGRCGACGHSCTGCTSCSGSCEGTCGRSCAPGCGSSGRY